MERDLEQELFTSQLCENAYSEVFRFSGNPEAHDNVRIHCLNFTAISGYSREVTEPVLDSNLEKIIDSAYSYYYSHNHELTSNYLDNIKKLDGFCDYTKREKDIEQFMAKAAVQMYARSYSLQVQTKLAEHIKERKVLKNQKAELNKKLGELGVHLNILQFKIEELTNIQHQLKMKYDGKYALQDFARRSSG